MSHRLFFATSAVVFLAACGSTSTSSPEEGSVTEVAASVVSGAMNNSSGSTVAMNSPLKHKDSLGERVMRAMSPIGTAYAANWSCGSGTLTPTFTGPAGNPYAYTPRSCTVTWDNDKSATSSWSGPFTLNYGAGCDSKHASMDLQDAGCALTRTTGSGGDGDTRTITGPDGNSYAITHNTNGAGTGWDTTVSPAPSNGGVVVTCDSKGCSDGRSVVINGSHLTGNVTLAGASDKIWDHTLSTGSSPLTVTGVGASRVVTGEVTVQHNLAKYTASVSFDSVGYGEPGCCFPTSGTLTATFSKGSVVGKTETLTFDGTCGDATLTKADGTTESITLKHCL